MKNISLAKKISKWFLLPVLLAVVVGVTISGTNSASAQSPLELFSAAGVSCTQAGDDGALYQGTTNAEGICITGQNKGKKPGDPGVNYCGDIAKNAVIVTIDFGCKHKGNAILDLIFAIIRFLTIGVGIVVIGSMIVAGIQFTASRGDPQATGAAMKRMASSASALALFIFIYAILNWVVPNTLLK